MKPHNAFRIAFAMAVVGSLAMSALTFDHSVIAGDEVARFEHLEQGWSQADRNWFYSANQGSHLVPYEWFLWLEVVDGEQLFRDPVRMERLHYLSRPVDVGTNPDGLPIGFVKDPARGPQGRNWLGLTCAACHTGQINYQGVGYRIDGGPGHGDIQTFLSELAVALQKTLSDNGKFQRFAGHILAAGSSSAEQLALRDELAIVTKFRQDFNDRNATKHSYGFARVDAFGIIMNEVLAQSLDLPQNAQQPNAPVSYPFLWDTPQHDFVQWNGAAPNRPLGTHILGPLARNVGEVLGVFGDVRVLPVMLGTKRGYDSSAHVENLFWIEQRLKKLQSPKWPASFPALDQVLIAKGAKIFARDCRGCHQDLDRADPRRRVKAVMTPLEELKTDPQMATNFAGRTGKTGKLEGRPKLLIGAKFGSTAPAAEILRHVIAGVIQRGIIDRAEVTTAEELAKLRKLKELDVRSSLRDLPTLQSLRDLKELVEALERLQLQRLDDLKEFIELAELLDLSDNKLGPLELVYQAGDQNSLLAYKARPLNGIWATAPYLHNGSVPNLDQLLRPALDRDVTFRVGSRKFDPVKVGLESGDDTSEAFVFRVKDQEGVAIPGNSNGGHEYGTDLSDIERKQLLEYLKSL